MSDPVPSSAIYDATTIGRSVLTAADDAAIRSAISVYSTAQVDAIIGGSAGIGGSTGATANRVLTANGTGGSTLQASPVTIDGSGNVTGVAALTASGLLNLSGLQIQLGASTGTGIQRAVSSQNVMLSCNGIVAAQGSATSQVGATAGLLLGSADYGTFFVSTGGFGDELKRTGGSIRAIRCTLGGKPLNI